VILKEAAGVWLQMESRGRYYHHCYELACRAAVIPPSLFAFSTINHARLQIYVRERESIVLSKLPRRAVNNRMRLSRLARTN